MAPHGLPAAQMGSTGGCEAMTMATRAKWQKLVVEKGALECVCHLFSTLVLHAMFPCVCHAIWLALSASCHCVHLCVCGMPSCKHPVLHVMLPNWLHCFLLLAQSAFMISCMWFVVSIKTLDISLDISLDLFAIQKIISH